MRTHEKKHVILLAGTRLICRQNYQKFLSPQTMFSVHWQLPVEVSVTLEIFPHLLATLLQNYHPLDEADKFY